MLPGDPAPLWPQELLVGFVSLQRGDQFSLCSEARTSAAGDPSGTKSFRPQSQHKCHSADSLARATRPMPCYPLLPDNATCTLPCPKHQRWPPLLPRRGVPSAAKAFNGSPHAVPAPQPLCHLQEFLVPSIKVKYAAPGDAGVGDPSQPCSSPGKAAWVPTSHSGVNHSDCWKCGAIGPCFAFPC